jgi:penicillin-binding protein 1C
MGAGRSAQPLMRRPRLRLGVAAAGLAALAAVGFWRLAPSPLFDVPQSAVLVARDGELLGARIASDGQWRFPPLARVPARYRAAVLAYEDKRFDRHWGVDPLAVLRAARLNLEQRRVVSGASTITMQLARLARAPRSNGEGGDQQRRRGMAAKLADTALALRLEAEYDKDEILALYASHAPFGGNVVGLEAAAWRYFGRDPARLSWAEAATLAVLPNQPALVTPGRNRARLAVKRDALLQRLHAAGALDDVDLAAALAEPLVGAPRALPDAAPHLLETLRRRHPQQHRFESTLDAALQRAATEIVAAQSRGLARQGIHNAAALVIDHERYEVLAYVGNAQWSLRNEHGYAVDVVQRPRSTGSVLKPLLYAAMLDSGQLLPKMLVPDVPIHYAGYAPENFDRRFRGAVPADVALAQSLNVPAVRLLRDYGVERFYDLLRASGMTTLTQPPDHYGLTLVLGGAEGNLWELTRLHADLVDRARTPLDGARVPRRALQLVRAPAAPAAAGAMPDAAAPGVHRLSPGAAWLTLNALLEVPRPDEEGSWSQFVARRQIAWKTGTSWGQRDAWAIGSSGRYTVGVWAGNASGDGRAGLTGGAAAAPILFALHQRLPAANWLPPPQLAMKRVAVCRNDGWLANDWCQRAEQWVPRASHFERQSPHNLLVHLDASGAARVDSQCERVAAMRAVGWFVLPPTQEHYYRRHDPLYRELPPVRADCAAAFSAGVARAPMEFLYPQVGAAVYIPRELDGRPGRVVLEAVHRDTEARLHWHLDGRYLGSTQRFHQQALDLAPGAHVVTVIDAAGQRLERRFTVLERQRVASSSD